MLRMKIYCYGRDVNGYNIKRLVCEVVSNVLLDYDDMIVFRVFMLYATLTDNNLRFYFDMVIWMGDCELS